MKTSHDSETPAQGLQVITACAFIYKLEDGVYKLFLPKRASTKKFLPNVFELPGGHLDFGESLEEGLKREIKEEFGKEIVVGDVFYAFTYVNEVKGSHSVEIIYFAQFPGDEEIELNPEDHSEYRWFSKEDLTQAFGKTKSEDDPEVKAIMKGFVILEGDH